MIPPGTLCWFKRFSDAFEILQPIECLSDGAHMLYMSERDVCLMLHWEGADAIVLTKGTYGRLKNVTWALEPVP